LPPRLRLGFGLTFDIPLAYGLHAKSREKLRSHVLIRNAFTRLIEFLTQADGIIALKENGHAVSLPNDLVGKAVTVRPDPESDGTIQWTCQVQWPALRSENHATREG